MILIVEMTDHRLIARQIGAGEPFKRPDKQQIHSQALLISQGINARNNNDINHSNNNDHKVNTIKSRKR